MMVKYGDDLNESELLYVDLLITIFVVQCYPCLCLGEERFICASYLTNQTLNSSTVDAQHSHLVCGGLATLLLRNIHLRSYLRH